MLYLAIDQHSKQITVSVRNEEGETIMDRQVSTRPEKIVLFFEQLVEVDAKFMAILECCGFNDWLLSELGKWNCSEIVLIHPDKPSMRKCCGPHGAVAPMVPMVLQNYPCSARFPFPRSLCGNAVAPMAWCPMVEILWPPWCPPMAAGYRFPNAVSSVTSLCCRTAANTLLAVAQEVTVTLRP